MKKTTVILLLFLFGGNLLLAQVKGDKQPAAKAPAHSVMMGQVLEKPKYPIKKIGILVYDGVNDLDLIGPRYVLGEMMGAKTQLIALKPGNIKTVNGIEIVPNTIIDSVKQLDILVIPGGVKGTILAAYDAKVQNWIRMIDEHSVYTTSVCTGGWILASTGLLKSKNATTNWYRPETFFSKNGVIFQNKRYVKDGKYWTSAGVTAGMDMSLAIINDIYGDNYTQGVMLDMEYDPQPPIAGGSPNKTKPEVFNMMQTMYDMGIKPLVDSLEKDKLNKEQK
jgi:putative intracellular protease/amidase